MSLRCLSLILRFINIVCFVVLLVFSSPFFPFYISSDSDGSSWRSTKRGFMTDDAANWQSIPQTRQYYENIVLGIEDHGKVEWCEEWEDESAWVGVASPRSAKGKEKERGKKRVSSGQSGA